MRIVLPRLEAKGIRVEYDQEHGILDLFPAQGWDSQAHKLFDRFCDHMDLVEEDRMRLGEQVADLQILRIIRQGM